MTELSQQLLLGAAKIDLMERDIDKLIKLLFWLAKHPRYWIRAHDLEQEWEEFHTSFGTLEKDGCMWEIWWREDEDSFRTRCLVVGEEDGYSTPVCVYGSNLFEPHKPRKSFEPKQSEYMRLWAKEGILRTYQHLDVFTAGMLHNFPLTIQMDAYKKAVGVKYP